MKIDPERDEVAVDGKVIAVQPPKCYLMLNKPRGYVTTLSDERGRDTAVQLVEDCGERVWPIGRLDMYSEGLLLFTNDGELTHLLEHPSKEIDKEYLVRVDRISDKALGILRGPIELDGQLLAPAQITVCAQGKGNVLLRFVIHEGKNRQIRRMCQLAGLRVLRLKRVREGCVSLGELKSGMWRNLTEEEVTALLHEVK
jgi:23S rRNA pseudouridine2605 synthase